MKICVPKASPIEKELSGSDFVRYGIISGLKKNSHQVLTPTGITSIKRVLNKHRDIDLILILQEDYFTLFVLSDLILEDLFIKAGFDKIIPIIVWFLDDPLCLKVSAHISPMVPLSFSQSRLTTLMLRGRVRYLPLFANTDLFRPLKLLPEERKRFSADVVFVGRIHHPFREKALDILEEKFHCGFYTNYRDKYKGSIRYEQIPKLYNAAKIVIDLPGFNETVMKDDSCNFAVSDAWNQRNFEIAACKTFQLVPYRRLAVRHFQEPSEVVSFRSIPDLENKISYYLNNDKERNAIAERAYRRAIREHSHTKRMAQLIKTVQRVLRVKAKKHKKPYLLLYA